MAHIDETPIDYTNLVPVYQQTYPQEYYSNMQVFNSSVNNNENLYVPNVSVDVGETLVAVENDGGNDKGKKILIDMMIASGVFLFIFGAFFVGWLIFGQK